VYFAEPNGGVIELYTDMEHVFAPARPPIEWADDDAYWFNQWDGLRNPSLGDYGTSPLAR